MRALVPVLLTAGAFLGFVALAGGAIVWTRFDAAQIPADQAVAAIPQTELVAIGAVLLLLFGLLGVLATLGMFLIDRSGRPTPGMSRGLLWLLFVEGIVVIVLIVDLPDWGQEATAAAVFTLLLILAGLVTRAPALVELEDDLVPRDNEIRDRTRDANEDLYGLDGERLRGETLRVKILLAAAAAVAVAWAVFFCIGGWEVRAWLTTGVLGLTVLWLAAIRVWRYEMSRRHAHRLAAVAAEHPETERDVALAPAPVPFPSAAPQPRGRRQSRPKPLRFTLTPLGEGLMVVLAGLVVLLPALIIGQAWVAAALGAAVALCVALWRIANYNRDYRDSFLWLGIAVFFSVPLFGAISGIVLNLSDPQVQPMALIRSDDGRHEAIQGLYVTETDDRVYFASIATTGCGKEIAPNSGRLLWVPRSEVVAMSVGPLQDVDEAGTKALEMYLALAPEAGSVAAVDGPALAVDGKAPPRRLEDVTAVRRHFGSGLSLDRSAASPGDEVTLSMLRADSAANGFGEQGGDEDGEGEHDEQRLVRVGNVPATYQRWKPRKIVFEVPPDARSGPVTVDCRPLATQPTVNVTRKPRARISVRLPTGSDTVVLDSRRSSDDGRIVRREWTVEGRRHVRRKRVSALLSPRAHPYTVRLKVTDADGLTDTAELTLLRLAAPQFDFAAAEPRSPGIAHLRRALVSKAETRLPEAIELHGHADDVGPPGVNDELSWRRAVAIRDILTKVRASAAEPEYGSPRPVPLTALAYGESCPLDGGGGRRQRNRRVDVFVLDSGVAVDPPEGCLVRRQGAARWRPFE